MTIGTQFTGRYAWPAPLTEAARKYTREPSKENEAALDGARRSSAREIINRQLELGFSFATDGGVGVADIFTPYVERTRGIQQQGNISKYPGTRNSYYHTPFIKGKLAEDGSLVERFLYKDEFPQTARTKAILPSPLSFALASENLYYSSLTELMLDFSEVLKKDINELASAGYDYVQLTEALLCNRTSTEPVSKDALSTFRDCIQLIFRSFGKRSALYFHSGDASPYLSDFLDLPVTDIGFDFNTPPSTLRGIQFDKNLILGLQNTTRKLPPESLANEPRLLAARSKSVIESLNISDSHEVFVSPSQDFDGVQTYPQAETRIENLANAVRLLNEGKA